MRITAFLALTVGGAELGQRHHLHRSRPLQRKMDQDREGLIAVSV